MDNVSIEAANRLPPCFGSSRPVHGTPRGIELLPSLPQGFRLLTFHIHCRLKLALQTDDVGLGFLQVVL